MKRRVWRVRFWGLGDIGLWRLTLPGGAVLGYETQRDAIASARKAARLAWKDGELAQVVVHGRDGRIRFEHTYGRDPRRHRG